MDNQALARRVKELGIGLGNRVHIIEPSQKIADKRFNELIGHEAIVIGFNEGTENDPTPYYPYYYHLYFLDKTAQQLYEKGGQVFFHPYCIEFVTDDPNDYERYLADKQKQTEELKYRNGKCANCSGPLFYGGTCVRCEKPTPDHHGAYDFLYLIGHAIANVPHHKLTQDDVWQYFDWEMRFANDSYQSISFEEEAESEGLQEVIAYIRNGFELKNEELLVYVSW